MRLPTGYGSVSKMKGKRRNPWRVRKTKEFFIDDAGKQHQTFQTVGYYRTKKEALEALAEFNRNPYDLSTAAMSFADVYSKWSEEYFQTISPSATRTVKSAYMHSEPLWKMPMIDIRVEHLEGCIRDCDKSDSVKARMKSLYNMMYRWSLKHEVVTKDYASLCFSIKVKNQKERVPFTTEEIEKLWANLDRPFADMVLVGIYSGWRPQELAILPVDAVDLDERIMTGGLKTEAGKNRIVPIHDKIFDLVKSRHDNATALGSPTLFYDQDSQTGLEMSYDKYKKRFDKLMKYLQMDHRPHETRHTFITIAKQANVDEHLLKLIVGHTDSDITEKVYTHRTIEDLRHAMARVL